MKKLKIFKHTNWAVNKSFFNKGFKSRGVDFAKVYFRRYSDCKVPRFEKWLEWLPLGLELGVLGGCAWVWKKATERTAEAISSDDVKIENEDKLLRVSGSTVYFTEDKLPGIKKALIDLFQENPRIIQNRRFTQIFLMCLLTEIRMHRELSVDEIYSRIMKDPFYGAVVKNLNVIRTHNLGNGECCLWDLGMNSFTSIKKLSEDLRQLIVDVKNQSK